MFDSGNTFENTLAKAGYWNDKRAEKKGVEPESVTVGTYGGTRMLFVGAERANAVGVYDITDLSAPKLPSRSFPAGKASEGLLALERMKVSSLLLTRKTRALSPSSNSDEILDQSKTDGVLPAAHRNYGYFLQLYLILICHWYSS